LLRRVTDIIPIAFGMTTGALLMRERRTRANAERLAAALLETLLNAIDATDEMTGQHVRRTARYALVLADAAGLDAHTQHSIERVALFHDVGKIHEALFDIIHEDAKLSEEQRAQIATHPQRGADTLAPLRPFYPELAEGVLSHHERWDGTGYPRGLRGERIPLAARIVSIADTFDAVTATRRYRRGRSAGKGAEVIAEGRGTQFDPDYTDLFLAPPVFEQIERVMQTSEHKLPPRRERRTGTTEDAPDLTFRWRNGVPGPQSLETAPQGSP
jgi:HD-GYP domain-containing protein (c-di-GMP phosphodiesterase class II)